MDKKHRKTLEAMLSAMKDSFPMFRKYWHAKAKKIGKEKLAWWDVFAPMGKTDKVYSFEEACDFIVENFGKFSPDLAALAKRASPAGAGECGGESAADDTAFERALRLSRLTRRETP